MCYSSNLTSAEPPESEPNHQTFWAGGSPVMHCSELLISSPMYVSYIELD